jgi:UDP-glucose 4-epimerase
VFHFAAPVVGADDDLCVDVILGGALALIASARAAGGVRRLVVASSSAVYGDSPSLIRHEASLADPDTPRACALLSAEHFCRAAFRRDGLQTVCLRFFEVYGPGMELHSRASSRLAPFLRAAVTGEVAEVADAGQARDWLHVDDAVEATLRAAAALRGVGGKVFNVGAGRSHSDTQICETLERLTGRPLNVRPAPPTPGGARPGRADTAAAAGLLQFTAAVTPDDGLARTLQWAESIIGIKELCSA